MIWGLEGCWLLLGPFTPGWQYRLSRLPRGPTLLAFCTQRPAVDPQLEGDTATTRVLSSPWAPGKGDRQGHLSHPPQLTMVRGVTGLQERPCGPGWLPHTRSGIPLLRAHRSRVRFLLFSRGSGSVRGLWPMPPPPRGKVSTVSPHSADWGAPPTEGGQDLEGQLEPKRRGPAQCAGCFSHQGAEVFPLHSTSPHQGTQVLKPIPLPTHRVTHFHVRSLSTLLPTPSPRRPRPGLPGTPK